MSRSVFLFLVLIWFGVTLAGNASGAGFALIEQSVGGLGSAFSGGAAEAADASTVFFNPAGLIRLKDPEAGAGIHRVSLRAKFDQGDSTHVLQETTGMPLLGSDGGDAGEEAIVPNFYAALPVSTNLVLGLGINSPFGLSTDYPSNWVGRYHALRSELVTININPALAIRCSDWLSVGIGFSAQYLDADLSNAIDFGTLDALGAFGLGPGSLGLVPQESDGRVRLEGDHWGYGFNVGILFEISERTRFGIAYRSGINHRVHGRADFSTPPELAPVQASSGFFTDSPVSARVRLPASFSITGYHRFPGPWAVMADATWTDWSRFDELRFEFANGQPDGVTSTDWNDSLRLSAGVHYFPGNDVTLRAGFAYDPTPISDNAHRTPRIPGHDRFWVAAGLGFKPRSSIRLDLGYAHLFVVDPKIDKADLDLPEDRFRGGLKGRYAASVDILSAQVSYVF